MVAAAQVGDDMRPLYLAGLAAAFALTAQATSFYLTISGAPGEPEYETRFNSWTNDITKAVSADPTAKSVTLSGKDATKPNILAKLNDVAAQSKADDTFVLTLIGHGSYDQIDYKFNIPGPDISATELANALNKIAARQLIVDATSASGGIVEKLQKEKRIIITATKAGSERNAAQFARFWAEALRDPAADTDKNQTLTAMEAYRYARQKTKDFFDNAKRLATEHSLLEDTGKGNGENDPSPANGQGMVATRFPVLKLGAASAQAATPAKLALLKKKEELETQIDELQYRKAAMDTQTYQRQLRPLLNELATIQAQLDQ
jgi:hypothetical protein